MKFDCIIMNPPYKCGLHIKIAKYVLKYLKDENSKIVNLSPLWWIIDPISRVSKRITLFKRNLDYICHFENIEILNKYFLKNKFDSIYDVDLGIYIIKLNYYCINKLVDKLTNKIIDKYFNKVKEFPVYERKVWNGIRVKIPYIIGHGCCKTYSNGKINPPIFGKLLYFIDGKTENGRLWQDCYNRNKWKRTTIQQTVRFNSVFEAKNFISAFKTDFGKYFQVNVINSIMSNNDSSRCLWLSNCINPRTGLKGYLSEWTDEDLYEYFGITEDEKKTIQECLNKYQFISK